MGRPRYLLRTGSCREQDGSNQHRWWWKGLRPASRPTSSRAECRPASCFTPVLRHFPRGPNSPRRSSTVAAAQRTGTCTYWDTCFPPVLQWNWADPGMRFSLSEIPSEDQITHSQRPSTSGTRLIRPFWAALDFVITQPPRATQRRQARFPQNMFAAKHEPALSLTSRPTLSPRTGVATLLFLAAGVTAPRRYRRRGDNNSTVPRVSSQV